MPRMHQQHAASATAVDQEGRGLEPLPMAPLAHSLILLSHPTKQARNCSGPQLLKPLSHKAVFVHHPCSGAPPSSGVISTSSKVPSAWGAGEVGRKVDGSGSSLE